jgi:hypothetical protein
VAIAARASAHTVTVRLLFESPFAMVDIQVETFLTASLLVMRRIINDIVVRIKTTKKNTLL